MPRQRAANTRSMIDQIAEAIARADGGDHVPIRPVIGGLPLAALMPLVKPTGQMIDAAHKAVWSDDYWAINSRRDFQRAVRAMILTAMKEGDEAAR
jgi:hypothetical protein